MTVQLDGPGVTVGDVLAVSRDGDDVVLTTAALDRMQKARDVVDQLA